MSPEAVAQPLPAFSPTPIDFPKPYSTEAFDQYVMSTYARYPLTMERGQGCRLWDTEGREYLDFVAGIATCTLGHAPPRHGGNGFEPDSSLAPCFKPLLYSRPRNASAVAGATFLC